MLIKTTRPMSRTALGKKVIIEPDAAKEEKVGSIIMNAGQLSNFKSGVVLSVGAAVTEIKKGQNVSFSKNSGIKVSINETAVVMGVDEVLWVNETKKK